MAEISEEAQLATAVEMCDGMTAHGKNKGILNALCAVVLPQAGRLS